VRARLARDPVLAATVKGLEMLAGIAIYDRHLCKATGPARGDCRDTTEEQNPDRSGAFHGALHVRAMCPLKRGSRDFGVKQPTGSAEPY
jgi:hypothetical protein